MSVAQFGKHVGQHLELLRLRHGGIELRLVASVHLVPVESVLLLLVVEEAVVLVDDPPQRLEVALRCVGKLILVDASDTKRQGNKVTK